MQMKNSGMVLATAIATVLGILSMQSVAVAKKNTGETPHAKSCYTKYQGCAKRCRSHYSSKAQRNACEERTCWHQYENCMNTPQ